MKRSYRKNGKKKKVKSVEKISKCYICCYGNSMYVFLCPCCLLIISCVASVLSSFTLSWVVTIHCTSLVLPHSFSAAVFSVFCCSMFDRVLLFEIACSSWGSPYQHQHLHKGLLAILNSITMITKRFNWVIHFHYSCNIRWERQIIIKAWSFIFEGGVNIRNIWSTVSCKNVAVFTTFLKG